MNKNIKIAFNILLVVTFILISLGGAVRAMHAGLACPDWPLCFGDVIPDYQIQVYYEFIHRVIAGIVGIATIVLSVLLFRGQYQKETKVVMALSLVVLSIQIIMGGLTVLKLLNFKIVTAHLGFGVAFFACLLWVRFTLSQVESSLEHQMPRHMLGLTLFVTLLIYVQIILGGLVSTNYAGLSCPDFPLCLGEFIPTLEGVVGIHVIHRLGAYTVAIAVVSFYLVISSQRQAKWMEPRYHNLAGTLLLLVLLQIGLGIANVYFKIPPLITVLHLAVATGLLGVSLRLLFVARRNARS